MQKKKFSLPALILCFLVPLFASNSRNEHCLNDYYNSQGMVLRDRSLVLRIQKDCSKRTSERHHGNLCIYERKDEAGKLKEEIKLPDPKFIDYDLRTHYNIGKRDLVVAVDRYAFIIVDLKKALVYGPFRPYAEGLNDAPDSTITFIGFADGGNLLLGTSFDGRSFIYDVRDLDHVRELFALQGRFHANLGEGATTTAEAEKYLFVLEDYDSSGIFSAIQVLQIGKLMRGDLKPQWTYKTLFKNRELKTEIRTRKIEGVICGKKISNAKCREEKDIIKIYIDKNYNNISSSNLNGILYPGGEIFENFELKGFIQERRWFLEQQPNSIRVEISGEADLEKGTFSANCRMEKLVVERLGNYHYKQVFIVFTEQLEEGKEKYLVLDMPEDDYFELAGEGELKDQLIERLLEQADKISEHNRHIGEGELLLKALALDLENKQVRKRLSQIGLTSGNGSE